MKSKSYTAVVVKDLETRLEEVENRLHSINKSLRRIIKAVERIGGKDVWGKKGKGKKK